MIRKLVVNKVSKKLTLNVEPNVLDDENFDLFESKPLEIIDDYSSLIEPHRYLVDYFAIKTGGKRMARREDLVPEELTGYLPFITLFDLDFDENEKLETVRVRLLGTGMASFYGEWTGENFDEAGAETLLQKKLPATYKRIMSLIGTVLDKKTPITMKSQQISEDRPHLYVSNLVIPLCDENDNINMIFLYSDIHNSRED